MVVLLVLPVVIFGVPLLYGHLFLTGDDLIQNLPLRTLVGQDLRRGIVPLVDPYIYSGTPLLGGFNAGAAYPATWLFGVLPADVAWFLNLSLVYDVALAGMYLFLRRQSISSTAATVGAGVFAFAGFLSAQVVHIDLVEGASWVPWILLSVHALTNRPDPSNTWAGTALPKRRLWVAVLAVSAGLSILAGGPESFIDGGTLAVIYLIYRLIAQGMWKRPNLGWSVRSVAAIGVGVVGGVAIGAAQLVPGLAFVAQSQRSVASYSYFTSGSLPDKALELLVSPFFLGTNQGVTGSYVGAYNLPEVTSYMGILALIAAFSLFAPRWRRRPEARRWWIWHVVFVIGILAALGRYTPFDHLLYLIPGVKNQRLVNRNLLLVDFSLAVLLAWWVHVLLDRTPGLPSLPRPKRGTWRRLPNPRLVEVTLVCIPVVLATIACVLLWTATSSYLHSLGMVYPLHGFHRTRLALIVTLELVIGIAATCLVLAEKRFGVRRLRKLLVTVMVVDLVVFSAWSIQPPESDTVVHATSPTADQLSRATGNGRFIAYDPLLYVTSQLINLGQTDLNVPKHLASAQGYAALVDNGYYAATGDHLQEDLNPATLAGPTWDLLNAHVLLTYTGYFVTPAPGNRTPKPTIFYPPAAPTPSVSAPSSPSSPRYLSPTARSQWYFGGVLRVRSGSIPVVHGAEGKVRIGVLSPTGVTRWLPVSTIHTDAATPRSITFSLPGPVSAAGVVVKNTDPAPVVLGVPAIAVVGAGTVLLDGPMQRWVTAPHWVFAGTIGVFGEFRNTRARGWAWAEARSGKIALAGDAVHAPAPSLDGSQRIVIHATRPATLVRSMAWATGWHATVQRIDPGSGRATGPVIATTVRRLGAIQQVDLPGSGTYSVQFFYRSGSALVGIGISAAATAVVIIWLLGEAIRRRRRTSGAVSERDEAAQ